MRLINEDFMRYQALQEQEVVANFNRLVARLADQDAAGSDEAAAADVDAVMAELDD